MRVFNDAKEIVSVYVKQPEPTDMADGASVDVYIAGHWRATSPPPAAPTAMPADTPKPRTSSREESRACGFDVVGRRGHGTALVSRPVRFGVISGPSQSAETGRRSG